MGKRQAIKTLQEIILPGGVYAQIRKEAWDNLTGRLCKAGSITYIQYLWTTPFEAKKCKPFKYHSGGLGR